MAVTYPWDHWVKVFFCSFPLTQMKHCCVEDPSDLCSVNISSQNLADVKEDDFALFDNVAYINAGENILPFGE